MELLNDDFISGEKFQLLCNVSIGTDYDITYNPAIKTAIANKTMEYINIETIAKLPVAGYNNPRYIFLYSHHIKRFGQNDILTKFANDFILITHNSDQNIEICKYVDNILEYNKLIHWWAQNLNIPESYSSKLSFLPIGIANSMWPHGKPAIYSNIPKYKINSIDNLKDMEPIKQSAFYFAFSEGTNPIERGTCKKYVSRNGIKFESSNLPPLEYIKKIKDYKFAICPIGNGLDTHRLWECFYSGVIPIVARNGLNDNIAKYIPIIMIDSWNIFTIQYINDLYNTLTNQYSHDEIYNNKYYYFSTWKDRIFAK
jgi:hypothetical protein